VLHEGTKVNVLDKAKGWMRIKLANGNEGWLKITDVKEI
jgi:SH3-like domain-containing protein